MSRFSIAFSVVVFAVVFVCWGPEEAHGECCFANFYGFCANCAPKDIGRFYCGKGDCNVAGCDCEGGCKQGSCRKARSVDDDVLQGDGATNVTGHQVVRWADADSDGALDAGEVMVYLTRQGVVEEGDAWRALDADGDGKLTASEIDADVQ